MLRALLSFIGTDRGLLTVLGVLDNMFQTLMLLSCTEKSLNKSQVTSFATNGVMITGERIESQGFLKEHSNGATGFTVPSSTSPSMPSEVMTWFCRILETDTTLR